MFLSMNLNVCLLKGLLFQKSDKTVAETALLPRVDTIVIDHTRLLPDVAVMILFDYGQMFISKTSV
jgi:hypothetical protein